MLKKQENKEVADLKKQIDELNNNWKRALADYQNLEKRTITRLEEGTRYASEKIIVRLFTVLDILKQSEKHIKDQGLSLAIKSFDNVLKDERVDELDVLGKKFNPLEMECIEVVESDKEDEVIEVVREGYKLDDKIIRVAQVKVGKKGKS